MIPVFEPAISQADIEAVTRTVADGWISSGGPVVPEFEKSFATYIGVEYCAAMSSGTAALEAAVHAVDLGPGDEVILPAFTIVSCVNAILTAGATPVFVDITEHDWNIDPARVAVAITEKTRAIMVVHMYGQPCEMDSIIAIAEQHSLVVIEDASQAHGAAVNGKKCGAIGHISVFSFYANKIITCGEGGAVLSDKSDYIERARSYRNLYFDKAREFKHMQFGQNFRLTSMQASLGMSQLTRIDEVLEKKKELADFYDGVFSRSSPRKYQCRDPDKGGVFWMNACEFQDGMYDIRHMISFFLDKGVELRHFFSDLSKLDYLRDRCRTVGSLQQTKLAQANGVYFPSGISLTEKDKAYIAETFEQYVQAHS